MLKALSLQEPFASSALWAASNIPHCVDSRAVHYLINHDFFTETLKVLLSSNHLLTTRLEAANVISCAITAGNILEIRELVLNSLEIIDALLLSIKIFTQNLDVLLTLLEATVKVLKLSEIKAPGNGHEILERFEKGGLEELLF